MDNPRCDLEIDVSANSPTTYFVEMSFRQAGREDESLLPRHRRARPHLKRLLRPLLDANMPAMHDLQWERNNDSKGRPLCAS